MRRALQRCSASVPSSLSSLIRSSRTAAQCFKRIDATRFAVSRTALSIRSLHLSSTWRQAATATADATTATPDEATSISKFQELGARNMIHPNVVRTLTQDMGLEMMTEVQQRTINEALKGQDIIAQAKTGTGKTLAFLLPIIQRIINVDPSLAERHGSSRRPQRTTADDIRGIIISPTRELAEQIAEEAKKVCRNTGIIVQTAVGGTQKSAGLRAIQRNGCHLLVGTPGRLKDILSDPYTKVEAPDLSAFVLDEADRLLDQGFWPEIQEIMRLLPTPAEKDRQTLMFSATVPREVVSIVRSTLKPGFNFVKCVRDDEEPTHARIPQKSVVLRGLENCIPALIELCQRGVEQAKEPGGKPFKAIVYFNSTAEVTLAASALMALQPPGSTSSDAFGRVGANHPWHPARVLEIHAKLSQVQRTQAAENFRRSQSGVLLSSDVTARGMDFPNVTHVIQVGLPTSREQYIHRIGRTGRAGKEGEGWIMLNQVEVAEASRRLRGLPLVKDQSLEIANMDLTKGADVPAGASRILEMYQKAIMTVSVPMKAKVYLAQLGVYQWYPRKPELVEMMNRLSRFGWGLATPPEIPAGLARKLNIDRIPGIRVGSPQLDNDGAYGGRDGSRRGFGGSGFNDRGGNRFGARFGDRFGDRSGDRFGGRGGRDGGRDGRRDDRRGGYGGVRSIYADGRPQRRTNDAFES